MEHDLSAVDFFSRNIVAKSFFLVDIDDMGLYNLRNSYQAGNNLIENVYSLIESIVKPVALTHLGSDEFLFVCLADFEHNRKYICALLNEVKSSLKITISVGCTKNNFTCNSEAMEILKTNVQFAKANGKDLICYK